VQCKWAVRSGDVALIPCARCRRAPDQLGRGLRIRR